MAEEKEPTAADETSGGEAEPAPEVADRPDPALESVLQEADRPDVSLISEMTKALKPGHHTVVQADIKKDS